MNYEKTPIIPDNFLIFSCEKENFNNNNPYLPNYSFNVNINMNLPQFSNLQFPSNAVYINNGSAGVRGIIVFNTGGSYVVLMQLVLINL